MIRINQIKVPIMHNQETLKSKIENIIKSKDFTIHKIVKKSIDARDKNELMYIYTIDIKSKDEKRILNRFVNNNNIMSTNCNDYVINYTNTLDNNISPIIIGAGPAGYFCGLYLARMGFKPVIFERGKKVEERSKVVEGFWNGNKIFGTCLFFALRKQKDSN